MSGTVDLAEFLSAYLVEMDEHLRAASAALMAADAALRKQQLDPRAVRDLFRALHTIKGLSAMVGVEPIVTIVHRMETAVRAADRSGGKLPIESVDVLFQGIAAIEQRVRALSDGKTAEPPPAALIAALDGIELDRADAPPAAPGRIALTPALADKLTPAERKQLEGGIATGQRALRLDFAPSPALAAQGIDINGLRARLAQRAEIVRVLPIASAPTAEAPAGLTFVLLLLTGASDAEIAEVTGLDVRSIQPLLEPVEPVEPAEPAEPAKQAAAAAPSPGSAPPPPRAASLVPVEADILEEEAEPPRRGVLRVEVSRVEEAMERLSALIVTRFRLEHAVAGLAALDASTREIAGIMGEHARQLRDLRAALLRVRMVSVAEVLDRVPLMIRGLRRATGKLLRIEIETRGAELDKVVAERIFPALIHLVRNAADHAIERPEERRAAGKPEEGLIRITCWARSNTQLELNVTDDGRGVDGDLVALRAGREPPQSSAALLDLLCEPGFSTRATATSTSGRGMGLDIVRRIIVGELGGELGLATRPGAGTTFTLRVPLTISIVDVFAFLCAGQRFVVPVTMVDEIIEIDPARLRRGPFHAADRDGDVALIERRGETIPVLQLDALLRLAGAQGNGQRAIVVRRAGDPVAFAVDRMLGQREAVVRPLEDPLVQGRGVSGSTDLGDGRPTVVLDLLALAGGLTGGGLPRLPGRGERWAT